MKKRTKKLLALVMCMVFMFSIVSYNTLGDSLAGSGDTYDFGGFSVKCEVEDHPAVGTVNGGVIMNCCLHTAASPFSWSSAMVNEGTINWVSSGAPDNYRNLYWELYQGKYPSYSVGLDIYNSKGISQGYSTGFGALTDDLTNNRAATTAPLSSAFTISSNALTATQSGNVQNTSAVIIETGSSVIYSKVTIPAGVTMYYSTDGSSYTSTTNSSAVVPNGCKVYFSAPNTSNGVQNISFTACLADGSTAYYIDSVTVLTPDKQVYSNSSGTYLTLQNMCFPNPATAAKTLSVTWTGTGSLKIVKTSSNPSVSDGNACYSLQGAVYTVYRYASDAQAGTNPYGTITLDANGEGVLNNIPAGTYYVKETTAPKGYALNSAISTVTVNAGATAVHNTQDVPQMDPARILLTKQGKDGVGLEGAEFTVKFYEGVNMNTDPSTSGHTADRTWVLKTDEDGYSALGDKYKISGDPFYYDGLTGALGLPLGTITIQETKAPEGYLLDDTVYVRTITADGIMESVSTYNAPIISNDIMQAPFALKKLGYAPDGTEITLSGAGFMACNVADLETDENGDYIFDEDKAIVLTTEGDKELFTDEEGYAESIKLDFGTYLVRETTIPDYHIACKDFIVVIDTNSDEPAEVKEIKNDSKYPTLKTTAIDVDTQSHQGSVSADAKVDDIVEVDNLIVGREYTIPGIIMDKATKQPLLVNGKEVTSQITFTATATTMEVKVPYSFDASGLYDKSIVFYESLYEGNSIDEGKLLAEHKDIDDENQTITYPSAPPEEVPPVEPPQDTPPTGDGTPVALILVVMMIAVAGVVVMIKKTKKVR